MTWPLVPVDGTRRDWYRLAANAINYLLGRVSDIAAGRGMEDELNSTDTPLGAGGIFTGEWVNSPAEHIATSFFTDQDGVMFIDISRTGGDTIAFSKRYDVVGGEEGRFDAFVKGARAHRVRFFNGPVAQTKLEVATLLGDNLYPFATTNRDAFKLNNLGVFNQTSGIDYRFYIDISDRVNYPHNDVGHAELASANFFYDKSSNCRGSLRLCVITRIDGTSADLGAVLGTSFSNSDLTKDSRDRRFVGEEINLYVDENGNVPNAYISQSFLNVTAVNTGITLPTGKGGTATPAVGDVIARTEVTAGTLTTAFYSGRYRGRP